MATIRNNTLSIISIAATRTKDGERTAPITLRPGQATTVDDKDWKIVSKNSMVQKQLTEFKTDAGKTWLEEVDEDEAASSLDGTAVTPGGEHADDSKGEAEQTAPIQESIPTAPSGPHGELASVTVGDAAVRIKGTSDRATLERWRDEEEDSAKPRKTILDAIDHRLDELEGP